MAVKNELSAGGIVFRRTGKGAEILLIKDHQGKWTFPKGHVERDEQVAEAARREVAEETGLPELTIREQLGQTDYYFKDKWNGKGETVHKTVRYYLLEAPSDAEPNPPQDWSEGVEPIAAAQWFPLTEAKKLSGYKDHTKLLAKAIAALDRPQQDSLLPS